MVRVYPQLCGITNKLPSAPRTVKTLIYSRRPSAIGERLPPHFKFCDGLIARLVAPTVEIGVMSTEGEEG